MKISLLVVAQLLYLNLSALGGARNFDPKWPAWYREYIACRDTKIAIVQFDEVPLFDALHFLGDKLAASVGYSLNFTLLAPLTGPETAAFKVSLSLENCSVLDALTRVFDELNASIRFEGASVVVISNVNYASRSLGIMEDSRRYVLEVRDIFRFKRLHLPEEVVPQGPTPQIAIDPKKRQAIFWGTPDEFQIIQQIVQSLQ